MLEKNWKELVKPSKLNVETNEDKSYAKITIEPLEKGFALTLGNALRRILLSSIQGTAVTAIQIDGVLHEFSSINGVREDVTDIVLNIKALSLKLKNPGPKKLILDAQGPGEIKAKNLNDSADIEILNPEQTICNLDDNTKVYMELTVNTGKGYVSAEKNREKDSSIRSNTSRLSLLVRLKEYLIIYLKQEKVYQLIMINLQWKLKQMDQ